MTERARPHGAQEYLGNGNHVWEIVTNDGVDRLRVPGGWLYRDDYTSSMAFVPVPAVVGYAV